MYFKQFYLGCLAHASYLIGSKGIACVVDPQRDIEEYLEEAKANGLSIKYIIETHLHADFVSGHKELADKTGAEIVFSHKANAKFPHRKVQDGDKLELGDLTLEVLETPGHTHESICILVKDKTDSPDKLLTGDTLFIGDVGRPDLVGAQGSTQEEMAGLMYDSLKNKILVLDDETEVYPAHGAGSLCGKNLSTDRSSTIGIQKKFNYALKANSKDEFIGLLCDKLPEIPQYFPVAVEANRSGPCNLEDLPNANELSVEELKAAMEANHTLVDLRSASQFGDEHIEGSLNIALGGQYASWCGQLVANKTKIVLIATSKEQVEEGILRLARAGHESVEGYFVGELNNLKEAGISVKSISQITTANLKDKLAQNSNFQLIDVRRDTEYESGHVPGAINIALPELSRRLDEVDKGKSTAVICRSGYRSSIATSILEKAGISSLMNVTGGTMKWIEDGFSVNGSNVDGKTCTTA